jgi:Zn-dependent M28 family amino/carboxypeptidase
MFCLESVGYYSDKQDSQAYPIFLSHFYPSEANFIALVGNVRSSRYVRDIKKIYQQNSAVPMETFTGYSLMAPAVRFSDHDSFWRNGFKAVMLTDTAFYRSPFYHTSEDTYKRLDYKRMAQVTIGFYRAILQMCDNLTL